MHYRLFITGTPRSGTRWMSAVLRSAGLRVGHEEPKRDGMVSSIHTVDDFYYVNRVTERRRDMTFDHVWMQTRDPRASIPSIAKALRVGFWHWQEKHTNVPGDLEPTLLKAMLYWIAWVPLARAQRPEWTYKLENVEALWPEIRDRLRIPECGLPAIEPSRYTSAAVRVSFEELDAIDAAAGSAVRKLASELGYG